MPDAAALLLSSERRRVTRTSVDRSDMPGLAAHNNAIELLRIDGRMLQLRGDALTIRFQRCFFHCPEPIERTSAIGLLAQPTELRVIEELCRDLLEARTRFDPFHVNTDRRRRNGDDDDLCRMREAELDRMVVGERLAVRGDAELQRRGVGACALRQGLSKFRVRNDEAAAIVLETKAGRTTSFSV